MPARIPVVEMIEIGAGGGSIAGVDRLGGSRSARAAPAPSPARRPSRGAGRPTVTDADATLGYIDPETFAEGRLRLDMAAAAAALDRAVGAPLALSAREAALGVSEIVDESMASAGRMHAVESGKDLGDRTMIAFGGNGPLHATRVAPRAGVSRILIPRDPGVGSAVGFLHAPVSFEIVRSRYATLDASTRTRSRRCSRRCRKRRPAVVRAGAPDGPLASAGRPSCAITGRATRSRSRCPPPSADRRRGSRR
jgi:N-methylhydantoinase A